MSFYKIIRQMDQNIAQDPLTSENPDISRIIASDFMDEKEFFSLLSDNIDGHLETLAQKAHDISLKQFGKTILLYTPMYLSNYCVNKCSYCGFNADNKVARRKLSLDEVDKEARFISDTGLKHILILTGESREKSPIGYIKDCIKILKRYFSSISIEIYPLTEQEYSELIDHGVDGLTIYQEVYDEKKYSQVHLAGPKTDYRFRLDAPERACKAGIRSVNIGSLLGLNDVRKEILATALHAKYLQDKYPSTEISISLPRMRPHEGSFEKIVPMSDKQLVRAIIALRLFLPRIGITISTRESAALRDNLVPLGVTKMSAGSTTAVGGHTTEDKNVQFDISDERGVSQIKKMLLSKGYQPVLKDWWYE